MAVFAEAMLLVRGGPDDRGTIPLSEGMIVIGRAPQSDLVLDDPRVSRQHAGIRGDPHGYWITDLGSRNGTFVNGQQIGAEPRRLRSLDRIELGGADVPIHWVFMESQATIGLPSPGKLA